jgi:hypothetical protein
MREYRCVEPASDSEGWSLLDDLPRWRLAALKMGSAWTQSKSDTQRARKGPSDDRTFREKVYRQAFSALERSAGQSERYRRDGDSSAQGLQTKITEIEAEYLPTVAPLPAMPPQEAIAGDIAPSVELGEASVAVDDGSGATGRAAGTIVFGAGYGPFGRSYSRRSGYPRRDDQRADAGRPGHHVETKPEHAEAADFPPQGDAAAAVEADRDLARTERRRPFAAIFLGVTLLCAAAIGIWWAIQTGLINPPSQEITGIEKEPADTEDFEPGAEGERSSLVRPICSAPGSWSSLPANLRP